MDLTAIFNGSRKPAPRMTDRPEAYALIHFGLNTWTDREWGYGDEDPAAFNPTEFNADQIAGACRDAGLTGLILVCKHHDGFCLWPTKTTAHNISKSPWRNGKGDLVREFSDACRRIGLKMGFYVSPWDRNNAAYGTPEYLAVYREQLREIYTNYGPAFEAWFDGANGGDGYYGGAREIRKIDHSTYYDWENTWKIVRDLQPGAAIFSDIGPDLRWVGNERGFADPDSFASITFQSKDPSKPAAPGFVITGDSGKGQADGTCYVPPECDFPLRRGWFYHAHEDYSLRSLDQLIRIYLSSVGSGGYFNIGLSPDRRGLLPEKDVKRLREFGAAVRTLFETRVRACDLLLTGGRTETVHLGEGKQCNLLELREDLRRGERVRSWLVRFLRNGSCIRELSGTAVGRRRIRAFETVEADSVEITASAEGEETFYLAANLYHAPEELLKQEEDVKSVTHPDYVWSFKAHAAEDLLYFEPARQQKIHGFAFVPNTEMLDGTPDHWVLEICRPGERQWIALHTGEFSNLKANPVAQIVEFEPVDTAAVRLRATHYLSPGKYFNFREAGLLICR